MYPLKLATPEKFQARKNILYHQDLHPLEYRHQWRKMFYHLARKHFLGLYPVEMSGRAEKETWYKLVWVLQMVQGYDIAGFQSRDTFNGWSSTPNGNTVIGFVDCWQLLVSCLFESIRNLMNFARLRNAWSDNMRNAAHQTFPFVKYWVKPPYCTLYII